jgi:hypothetical protein
MKSTTSRRGRGLRRRAAARRGRSLHRRWTSSWSSFPLWHCRTGKRDGQAMLEVGEAGGVLARCKEESFYVAHSHYEHPRSDPQPTEGDISDQIGARERTSGGGARGSRSCSTRSAPPPRCRNAAIAIRNRQRK